MVFDRKYLNIDTGKYDTDKLPTMYSEALSTYSSHHGCADPRHTQDVYWHDDIEPIFIPKDNDFDEECRRDEEKKKEHEKLAKEKEESRKRLESINLIAEHKRRLDKEFEACRQRRIAYDIQLAEVEGRLQSNRDYVKHLSDTLTNKTNVRPNTWRVK